MALRLKQETREAWKKRTELDRWVNAQMGALEITTEQWRPVPRSEPEPPEHTDMFIKGYVD